MNPTEWLNTHAEGFSALSKPTIEAIINFTFLWSLFENKGLNTNASADKVLALTHKWKSTGHLRTEPFNKSLSYFKSRYFQDGQLNSHFKKLSLRRNDNKELVESVLKSQNKDDADNVAVLLIIVLRLRNNLFHGLKWATKIRGQLDNFTNANEALMAAVDLLRNVSRV